MSIKRERESSIETAIQIGHKLTSYAHSTQTHTRKVSKHVLYTVSKHVLMRAMGIYIGKHQSDKFANSTDRFLPLPIKSSCRDAIWGEKKTLMQSTSYGSFSKYQSMDPGLAELPNDWLHLGSWVLFLKRDREAWCFLSSEFYELAVFNERPISASCLCLNQQTDSGTKSFGAGNSTISLQQV